MESYSIQSHQTPYIYDRFSPFSEYIDKQSCLILVEIRENLESATQFEIWSNELKKFIFSYGLNFTKIDHLKFINIYLSMLSNVNLNYEYVAICFDMLFYLLRRTRLITRDDLTIDWRILYHWAQSFLNNHDLDYSLDILPKNIEIGLSICAPLCSPYYSLTATEEILTELRPQMYPTGSNFMTTMKMLKILLPYNQGFRLWLGEFFDLWQTVYNQTVWEIYLLEMFSQVAWYNIGYIDWECWFPKIFTRLLRGFSLPTGNMSVAPLNYTYYEPHTAKWIVAMIGNGNSCLRYLADLLMSIKSFYHPSNNGTFQAKLVNFLLELAENFTRRVQLERTSRPTWSFAPEISHRLTEQDITDFVNCIKDYVFISIFNKTHAQNAVQACQYLSILRHELIIPIIVKKHFSSIDSLTEPHRYTAILNCLKYLTRQLCYYPEEQIYVIPLLMSVLPGIDLNDMEKTSMTLEFLNAILTNIICVDCSSAVSIRNDLTEIEKQICLSTSEFPIFIDEFLNRIFYMINILSEDISDTHVLDHTIQMQLTSILFHIVQQCSEQIYRLIQTKMMFFVSGTCLSSQVRPIVSCLIRGLVKGNSIETLKYFLPKTCQSIVNIKPAVDDNEDIELTWFLSVFTELIHARGDILINYKTIILEVFHHSIHMINKKTYGIVATAAEHLLQALCQVYSIDFRLTTENIDEQSFRLWGKSVGFDELQVQFHIPNEEEIDFAWEFINTFIYPALQDLTVSDTKRQLKSLTIIESIAAGCFQMIPPVPCRLKYQIQFPIYSKTINENLRMRIFNDIGKFLDQLLENHSDNTSIMIKALNIFYRTFTNETQSVNKDLILNNALSKNKLIDQGRLIRCWIIQKIELSMQSKESFQSGVITEFTRQVILKLFELSIYRYSSVRYLAQKYLFSILQSNLRSYEIIIDRIIQILDSSNNIDHDQIKGCLYVLLGDDSFSLIIKSSWQTKEKLWPLIARMSHANKQSTTNLYERIIDKIQNSTLLNINLAIDLQSYTNLMETLSQLIQNGTWIQQTKAMPLLTHLLQRNVPVPLSCVQTFVDFLRNDDIKLRKYSTKAIAALCRLQKPPCIRVEKVFEGDNSWLTIEHYQPPQTQIEWEQTCFLDKTYLGYYAWPKVTKYALNKRERYTQENMPEQVAILYDRFMDKEFLIRTIQLAILDKKHFSQIHFRMFKGIFRNFGLAFFDNFMEQLYALIHETAKEKQEGSHRVAAEIVAGMIRGSKHWTLEMLDKLWSSLRPFLTEVCNNLHDDLRVHWYNCFACITTNRDPRRIYQFIDFLRTFINKNDATHWSLLIYINRFGWRIPSMWHDVIESAKTLLDHSSPIVRTLVANLLAAAFSFDIDLFNRNSIRQPSINQFMDDIYPRLQQNVDLSKTIVNMHKRFFLWSIQPAKTALLQLLPHFCEMETMEMNDIQFKNDLTSSRIQLALTYLNTEFIDELIEQLKTVMFSSNSKWHARRVVIEFVQHMIFCNLFNIRTHAQQLRELVIQGLFDEQYEVRMSASVTLSGLYQCRYFQVTDQDLNHFRVMSRRSDSIVQRHGGILGLCSIVSSSPYDIPSYIPNVLMLLCNHPQDFHLIQKSIRTCLSEFHRTHYDSWHEHQQHFTNDQLVMLEDMFISHSYYA